MTQNDKVCLELAFIPGVSQSQRMKVKNFWKYIDDEKPLQPQEVKAEKQESMKKDSEFPKCKRMWYKQFKTLKEHGLHKVALAASKACTFCSEQTNCRCSEFAGTQEESYDELLQDMKAFDEKLEERSKPNDNAVPEKSSA